MHTEQSKTGAPAIVDPLHPIKGKGRPRTARLAGAHESGVKHKRPKLSTGFLDSSPDKKVASAPKDRKQKTRAQRQCKYCSQRGRDGKGPDKRNCPRRSAEEAGDDSS